MLGANIPVNSGPDALIVLSVGPEISQGQLLELTMLDFRSISNSPLTVLVTQSSGTPLPPPSAQGKVEGFDIINNVRRWPDRLGFGILGLSFFFFFFLGDD